MQNADATGAPADYLSAVPLNTEDFATAAQWEDHFRANGVGMTLATCYEEIPDAIEVSRAWTEDVRWLVYRDVRGVWADDFDTQDRHGPATMAGTLATIGRVMGSDRAATVAHIPASFRGALESIVATEAIVAALPKAE
jgi:hypothetical protein